MVKRTLLIDFDVLINIPSGLEQPMDIFDYEIRRDVLEKLKAFGAYRVVIIYNKLAYDSVPRDILFLVDYIVYNQSGAACTSVLAQTKEGLFPNDGTLMMASDTLQHNVAGNKDDWMLVGNNDEAKEAARKFGVAYMDVKELMNGGSVGDNLADNSGEETE